MKANLFKLFGQLCVAILLILLPDILYAGVSVKNNSTYMGSGRWNWTIYIDTDAITMAQIKCVNYHLHPTFAKPDVQVCNSPDTGFGYSANGWGTFNVGVEVLFKDGNVQKLQHALAFEAAKKARALDVRPENWSREIEPGWWEWGIYLAGSPAELGRIRCVEYTLHPSFPNPVRVVCTPQKRFELVARGWGTFNIQIKVMLQDGTIRNFSHQLRF